MAITESALDERLRRADRAVALEPDGGALAALASRTRTEARRRSLRNRLLGGVGAAALAIALGVAVPANAATIRHFLAELGRGLYPGTEQIDGSEWVDLGAADLPQYIASRWESWLPLAPGQSKQALIDQVVAEERASVGAATDEGAAGVQTQEVGFRRRWEQLVYDAWLQEWFRAHEAGDAAAQAAALEVLQAAPTWPALVETDGGGITAVLRTFADELAAGDDSAAQVLAEFEQLPEWDGVDRFESRVHPVICADLEATGKGSCDD